MLSGGSQNLSPVSCSLDPRQTSTRSFQFIHGTDRCDFEKAQCVWASMSANAMLEDFRDHTILATAGSLSKSSTTFSRNTDLGYPRPKRRPRCGRKEATYPRSLALQKITRRASRLTLEAQMPGPIFSNRTLKLCMLSQITARTGVLIWRASFPYRFTRAPNSEQSHLAR